MSFRSVSSALVLVSAALAASVVGCKAEEASGGSGSTDTGPVYKYPTQADFCLGKAKAECSDGATKACNTSTDACVTARSAANVCNPAGLPYDPAPAEACVTALGAAWADGKLTYDELATNTDACTPVFSQKHPEGDLCSPPNIPDGAAGAAVAGWEVGADVQCDTSKKLTCVIPTGKEAGKCAVAKTLGAGDDCSVDGSVCGEHLYCNQGTCAKSKLEGEACSDAKLCDAAFVCTNGACVTRGASGAECTLDSDCAGAGDAPMGFCIKDKAGKGQCFEDFTLNPFATSCDTFK